MKGSVVFAAILSACAVSGGERAASVEQSARDPWALPQYEDAVGRRCPSGGRRCPSGVDVPECGSAPAASELSAIDRGLLVKLGQPVTVVAKPTYYEVICTLVNCDCCNRCRGPIVLCGNDARCEYSIEIGSCDGNQSLTCCSIASEDRPLVARGVLRKQPAANPIVDEDGTKEAADESDARATFELEQPQYCYLVTTEKTE